MNLYFLLVFVLAVPFWLWGGGKLPLPINLPAGALVAFVPMAAACAVTYRQQGRAGVVHLLKRTFDFHRTANGIWFLPALLLPPLIYALSYAILRWTGRPLPETVEIPLSMAPVFFAMFFVGGAGEELGWSAHAIDPMQDRWGVARASLALGVVWAIWHSIPYMQTGNSAAWIMWQSAQTVGLRVLLVWIYNRAGRSAFAAILMHVTANMSWSLFPNFGSHYDPMVTSVVVWAAAAIVLLGWRTAPSGVTSQAS